MPPFAQGLKNVFTLRNVPDVDAIKARLGEQSCRKVLVAGGGFIGLECAENLKHAGYDVTIIEAATQVLTNLDYDMAQLVHQELNRNGIRLQLSSPLMGLTQNADGTLCAVANTTENYDAVIMALGGRPDSSIAKEAGLAVDERGFIYVNEYMQTSDESVYALGDAIRLKKVARGRRDRLALAGPANKEARIACTHIINSLYKKSKLAQARCEGFLGASAVKVFDLEAACVGFNERELSNVYKTNFAAIWLHPFNHAGYYPESAQMNLKVIYNPADFTILGAQAVGKEAVKRIEVISAYLGKQGGADDLAAHEQVYAPPFSSARDGVNFAGCVLQNIRDGLVKMARYDELDTKFKEAFLLDVRSPEMFNAKHIPGFVNIPLDKLRERLKEVPQTKPVVVACVVGVSAYIACRILAANGYDVYDLSGGVNTYFAANYKVQ